MTRCLDAPIPFAGVENPRAEIRDFKAAVLWDLITHPHKWRRPGRMIAPDAIDTHDRCDLVREAVEHGRCIGLEIEGDLGLGYRLVGIAYRRVWTVKPGRPAGEESAEEAPGQLSLVEAG